SICNSVVCANEDLDFQTGYELKKLNDSTILIDRYNTVNGVYLVEKQILKVIDTLDCECLRSGFHKLYRSDGSVFYEANYLNNKLHGKAVFYDQTGEIISTSRYINGLKHGIS